MFMSIIEQVANGSLCTLTHFAKKVNIICINSWPTVHDGMYVHKRCHLVFDISA